jgi:GxxExxY protein
MSGLPDDDLPSSAQLCRRIVGLGMRVHRELGCGFSESIYREALVIELESEGIAFEVHPTLPVYYKGKKIGVFQADLIIDGNLIVELKAVEFLAVAHSVQLVGYLCASGIDHGLLLNFGAKSLQFKTKTRTHPSEDKGEDSPDLHS